MRSKQRKDLKTLANDFKALSPARRLAVSVASAIGLGLIVTAQRDLQRRPPAEVRGSRLLWRLVCLNVLGTLIYFRWGRRQ
jgi:hypothetical protein